MTPMICNMPAPQYHADPCPTPSLSAGMINRMLDAPALCFHESSRLNPGYVAPEAPSRFTIGSVAHLVFLEPNAVAESVVVVDAEDWRTKDAKAQRDEARAAGKEAILRHQMDAISDAREAFTADPFIRAAFMHGKTEQSMFWKHASGIWCRARPDFIAASGMYLCDYKTTANANPTKFGRHAYNLGYHRRAAWYLDGYAAITGRTPDHYWFINQEMEPPYLTSVVELDMTALEAGRMENERAARLFAKCLDADHWPGYCDNRAVRVPLPTYALMEIDGRAAMEEF